MNLYNYQIASQRTMKGFDHQQATSAAALGLVGEAAELVRAFNGGKPSEEAGDFMFYAAMCCYATGDPTFRLDTLPIPMLDFVPAPKMELLLTVGDIADFIKKYLYHRKPFEAARLAELLGISVSLVGRLLSTYDIPFHSVLEANVEKLWVRFPNGFTTEDANARADEKV